MSYCLNPACSQPQNSDVTFCQSCGTKLLLRKRYRAVRQIGQGGFGKTFLAVDQDLPNKPACVIKQFSPQIQGASGLQKATELFEQEAVQLNILGKHPQIPELLAHFEQDGRLYLVQEYVKGRNLAEELAQDGAFSEAKIRELLVGLLPVLQYIHDNQVIHRDIKPENIIRRDDGKLFLVDFGAVKLMTGTALLGTGTVIGDPRYMSPEQLRGKADGSSDLYALGVTCLHLITDVDPLNLFDDAEGEWVWRDYLSSSVDSGIDALLDKMVVRAMKKRYISASNVLSDLGVRSEIVVSEYSESQVISEKVNAIQIQSLKPVQIGNKYGYENESGQVVTKLLFDEAEPFCEGLAQILFNGKWGYINAKGEIEIEPQFKDAWDFEAGLAIVQSFDGKFGFINTTGEFEINPQFDDAFCFNDGLARVLLNGKYAFINRQGKIILEPNFDFCDDFAEGLAIVVVASYKETYYLVPKKSSDFPFTDLSLLPQIVGKYGFINTKGEVVIKPQFDFAFDFDGELAMIGIGTHSLSSKESDEKRCYFSGKVGLIDKTGRIIVKPTFDDIGEFENGVAKFKKADSRGFINSSGKVIIEIEDCYGLEDFNTNGVTKFAKANSLGFVNSSGRVIIEIEDCYELEDFNTNGITRFSPSYRSRGFIDNTGKIMFIIEDCSCIKDFSDGLAAFETYQSNEWGYVNLFGKIVIKPRFKEVEPFKNGYARVRGGNWFSNSDKWRRIDKNGKFVD